MIYKINKKKQSKISKKKHSIKNNKFKTKKKINISNNNHRKTRKNIKRSIFKTKKNENTNYSLFGGFILSTILYIPMKILEKTFGAVGKGFVKRMIKLHKAFRFMGIAQTAALGSTSAPSASHCDRIFQAVPEARHTNRARCLRRQPRDRVPVATEYFFRSTDDEQDSVATRERHQFACKVTSHLARKLMSFVYRVRRNIFSAVADDEQDSVATRPALPNDISLRAR